MRADGMDPAKPVTNAELQNGPRVRELAENDPVLKKMLDESAARARRIQARAASDPALAARAGDASSGFDLMDYKARLARSRSRRRAARFPPLPRPDERADPRARAAAVRRGLRRERARGRRRGRRPRRGSSGDPGGEVREVDAASRSRSVHSMEKFHVRQKLSHPMDKVRRHWRAAISQNLEAAQVIRLCFGHLREQVQHCRDEHRVGHAFALDQLTETFRVNFGIVTWRAPRAGAANMVGKSAM